MKIMAGKAKIDRMIDAETINTANFLNSRSRILMSSLGNVEIVYYFSIYILCVSFIQYLKTH